MSSNSYDAIVIGLGSSGVTAATTLARAGRKVLGVEAQGRIGGRVNTVPFGDGYVELGAEWIHGQYPSRVYDSAVNNNVTTLPQDLTFINFRSDGTLADEELMNDLMTYSWSIYDDIKVDYPMPLGKFMTDKIMKYVEETRPELLKDQDFLIQFLEFQNQLYNNHEASNDWHEVSTISRYTELEGHQHMSWHRHGYKTFFEILLNTYNNGPGLPNLNIKLNTEVVNISYSEKPNEKVVVTTRSGDTYTANNVIVTVSLGVLKERHTTLFSPNLPHDKVAAINHLSMGVMDKIILSFDQPWWPQHVNFFGLIWKGDDKKNLPKEDVWITKIFGASRSMGSGNTLTLWTSGNTAKYVELLPEDVVQRKCVELLQKFMGANITIPQPSAIIKSNWFTNPFTRGSYSFDNLDITLYPDARTHLARPITDAQGKPRVLFAGEATDEIHFSTVHGASDSGFREANRLLTQPSKI